MLNQQCAEYELQNARLTSPQLVLSLKLQNENDVKTNTSSKRLEL